MSRTTAPRRYLDRLRRRYTLSHSLGTVLMVLALIVFGVLFAALVVGPLAGGFTRAFVFGSLGLAVALLVRNRVRQGAPVRASQGASLVAPHDPSLVSAVRSAASFESAEPGSLEAAHLEHVTARLAELPESQVIRWTDHLGGPGLLIASAVLAVAVANFIAPHTAPSMMALVSPEQSDTGERLAPLVAAVDVTVRAPEYLQLAPAQIRWDRPIRIPSGATLSVDVHTHLAASEARAVREEDEWSLSTISPQRFGGTLAPTASGAITFSFEGDDGERISDRGRYEVIVVEDAAPEVAWLSPSEDIEVALGETVPLRVRVTDDHGVADVILSVALEGEPLSETPLSIGKDGIATYQLDTGSLELAPEDTLTLIVKARDGDTLNGPNETASVAKTLTIASESGLREEAIGSVRAARDAGVDALAPQLELTLEMSDASKLALREKLGAFETATLAASTHSDTLPQGAAATLRAIARRTKQASEREQRFGSAKLTKQLEDDVLTLDALLREARVEDAMAIARELEALRAEMRSLVAELRRTNSPATRRRLARALQRAERRLTELAARAADDTRGAPGEFVNMDALSIEQTQEETASIRQAFEQNDWDEMERKLIEMEQRIDAIAKSLQESEASPIGDGRVGERQRALAEAMDRIAGLEAEQRQLAGATGTQRRRLAEERNEEISLSDAEKQTLREQAERALAPLEEMAARSGMHREYRERALRRARDSIAAMESGDLASAQDMARRARDAARDLSRDLRLSAMMFPGPEGGMAGDSRSAESAARKLGIFERALDRAIPSAGPIAPAEQQAMGERAGAQGRARGATSEVKELLLSSPDGEPLHPEAAAELALAEQEMQRAEDALARHDLAQAEAEQEAAGQRLTELREQMESESQSAGGGGGGGEPQSGDRVAIPGAEGTSHERRQRILDAMRDGAPTGYERSVSSYYEELLR